MTTAAPAATTTVHHAAKAPFWAPRIGWTATCTCGHSEVDGNHAWAVDRRLQRHVRVARGAQF